MFSDTFGDGNFGVLFSVAADDRVARTDYFVVPDYDRKFFNNPVDETGNPMPPCPVRDAGGRGRGVTTGYITPGIQIGDVERLNVSSASQWRPNDRTEVVLDLFTGRGGRTVEELWSQTGSQGYLGAMIPGCPNLWTLYGPNTNGGLLVPAFQEMETLYALKCIERLILDDRKSIDVREEPYRRYNEMLDERNRGMAWSDSRAENYYWTKFGRSATQNPLTPLEVWNALREPDFADLDVR